MLFDTLKRKNKAEQEERAWSQQAPAAYESRNKETMDALTGQVGSGYDGSTLAKAYQQYREQAADAAAKSAENAQATAAALAGGYGSSYADSVARQNQAAALEGIASAVPGLRSKALTEYQNEQNGLLAALSGMGTTEALDRLAYGSNLANYNNQLNFLRSQSAQARNENDNFWNNVWNGIKTAGNVARSAYDGYMGYTQQQWENEMAQAQFDFQKQQYADSLARQSKADNTRAYEDAFNLYKAGAGDAASDVLNQYGLNADAFANYTGAPITRDDQASALSAAASLVADGNTEAAANLLKMYGMDADAAGTYTALMQRQLATAAAKAALTKTGSSGRSSGSSRKAGASGGSNHGYTNAQLLQMSKTYSSMKDSDPQKEYYQQVLTDAGYLEPETVSAAGGMAAPLAGVEPYTPASSKLHLSTVTKKNGNTAQSGSTKSSGMPYANALNYAKGWKAKGLNANEIATRLMNMGASDDVIDRAMQNAGF
jgi:hypothetical protein|nr:MAG TPA: hypothetical protein [Caudoviricetes sp.]